MTVNERIGDLLREKTRTQKELAEFIGVSQNTISDWINKGKSPSANLMYRISDFFNISFNYLFTGLDNDNLELSLSQDYIELLDTYEKLDSRGKHKIHTALYEELDRINGVRLPENFSKDVG